MYHLFLPVRPNTVINAEWDNDSNRLLISFCAFFTRFVGWHAKISDPRFILFFSGPIASLDANQIVRHFVLLAEAVLLLSFEQFGDD